MAVVCLSSRSWTFACLYVCVCVCVCFFHLCFLLQPPSVWPHWIYMLRPTFTDYLFRLFCLQGRRCWFPSSPSGFPFVTCAHSHTHTHAHTQPCLLTASPLRGRGYAVSCRLGLSLGGSPGGKPERERGVDWAGKEREEKKKRSRRKILGSRFVLWIESREWKRDLENESEFRQGSGGV